MHPDRPVAPPPVAINYIAHCRGRSIAATRRDLPWLLARGFPAPLPSPNASSPR